MEALLSWTHERLSGNWGRAGVQPRSLNLQEGTCSLHPQPRVATDHGEEGSVLSDFMKKGTDLQERSSTESQILNLEQSWGTGSLWERRQARPPGFGLERPGGTCPACGQLCGRCAWGAGGKLLTQCLACSSWQPGGWAGPESIVGGHVHRPAAVGRSLHDPEQEEMLTF